jgi:hypothetical protein
MPLDFTATESGFDNGMGGASNAAGTDEQHYVLFGKDADGIYFEARNGRGGVCSTSRSSSDF